jgi:hypothetical protein
MTEPETLGCGGNRVKYKKINKLNMTRE